MFSKGALLCLTHIWNNLLKLKLLFINIHVNIFKCYHALRSSLIFIAGAQACAIVFSTVDRDSFEAVEKWKSKVCCSTWNYMYVLHARGILSGFSFVIIVANFTRMTMSVINCYQYGSSNEEWSLRLWMQFSANA